MESAGGLASENAETEKEDGDSAIRLDLPVTGEAV